MRNIDSEASQCPKIHDAPPSVFRTGVQVMGPIIGWKKRSC